MAARQAVRRTLFAALLTLGAGVPLHANATHLPGHTLWTQKCSGCHSSAPIAQYYNAAGSTSAAAGPTTNAAGNTLSYVIANVPSMSTLSTLTSLTSTERDQIAEYVHSVLPASATTASVAVNGSVAINIGSGIRLGQVAFSNVRTTTGPANGTITYGPETDWPATSITYTPNANFIGYDTFAYRGYRSGHANADSRLMTIKVGDQPLISSDNVKAGNVGVPLTYTLTATNPATFTVSGTLPAGLTFSGAVISGTPTAVSSASVTTMASNVHGSTSQVLTFDIAPGSQVITFPAQTTAARTVSPGTTFAISPLATLGSPSSGNPIVYSSLTPGVCTVSGTTVTAVGAGTCTLAADAAGDANYLAAAQKTQSVAITILASVPGAPTGVSATAGNGSAKIFFSAPASDGGAPITGYTVSCSPAGSATGPGSPVTVTGLSNGVLHTCSVRATNAAGQGPASSSIGVTPTATLSVPVFRSATITTFNVLRPGTFNFIASGVPAPTFGIVSGGLPAGVALDAQSGVLSGTPAAGTEGAYDFTVRATNSQGSADQFFTILVAKTSQSIGFTDPADRKFSAAPTELVAVASSGLPVAFASTTQAVCTVSGATVTIVTVGTCTVQATQGGDATYAAAAPVTQSFVITKGDQAITFGPQLPQTRPYTRYSLINPVATTSSGLEVAYRSTTAGVCSVDTPPNLPAVWMNTLGTCTIEAYQPGDANWNAALPVQQSITAERAAQTLVFPPAFPAALFYGFPYYFFISPEAATNSDLQVTYTTLTPSVCVPGSSRTAINMVGRGTCTIAANQGGDSRYFPAAQKTQDVAVLEFPGPPRDMVITPRASGELQVSFSPPLFDGGGPILGYRVFCNPGNPQIRVDGEASPIIVTGLTNGQSYGCTVVARNALGTGQGPNLVYTTPGANGPGTWTTHCSACHGATPSGTKFNAAGTTTTVLDYVIAHQPQMGGQQGLTAGQRADLVAHITSYLQPVQQTTAPGLAKTISVGGHLTIGTVSFNQVEVVTPPASGTLGAFSGARALYTPAPGFTGSVTFQYRGRNTNANPVLVGDTHTATINVDANALVLSVAISHAGRGSITVTSSEGTSVCSGSCGQAFAAGTLVTLVADAEPGFAFTGWSGACSGSSQCELTMDASKNATANFASETFLLSITKSGTGTGFVMSNPAGISCGPSCSATFPAGASVLVGATASDGHTFAGWTGAGCSGTGPCTLTMSGPQSLSAAFAAPVPGALRLNPDPVLFDGQSMGTSSPPLAVTLTNTGGTAVTVATVSIDNDQFTQANDCTTVAAGSSCTIHVTFSPVPVAGPLIGGPPVLGTLRVTHDGAGSTFAGVAGNAEKSLVTHYYRSILRRAPDPEGKQYWEGEALRMSAHLGANVNETWYAMATFFFSSAEYTAFNRDATGFVTDLYVTFFNRAPDAGGLAYWVGQLDQGMPREVVLVSFMLSPEFKAFTQAIFGDFAARAEVDVVMDFYRGLLSRLPDVSGFFNWVNGFRSAQCHGSAAVYAMVEQISSGFATSGEYLGRGRTNGQYVGDLYNAFLRRGGDLAGVRHWINQLDTGAQTREQVRQAFISTPEFNGRAGAILAESCLQ